MADDAPPPAKPGLPAQQFGARHLLDTVVFPFDAVRPLGDYVRPTLEVTGLWETLVEAVQLTIPAPSGQPPPLGAVLADVPLLGLAAVQARFDGVVVPTRSSEPELSRDRFAELLGADRDLPRWLRAVEDMDAAAGPDRRGVPIMMRAWDVPHAGLGAGTRAVAPELLAGRQVVFLLRSAETAHELDVVIDVSSRTADILRVAIGLLGIPVDGIVERLLRSHPPAQLLLDLDTEDHEGFRTLVQQQTVDTHAIAPDLLDKILDEGEEKPREAASLFVAAHFPRLPPSDFLELSDLLSTQTPSRTPGQAEGRDPAKVSNAVLQRCGIGFAPRNDGGRGSTLQSGSSTPGLVAVAIRAVFDFQAALLKERYLQVLAIEQTLGHVSDRVAGRYAEMEAEAVAATASEPEVARERLCRAVYGYPAVLHATQSFLQEHRRSVQQRFLRGLRRAPALLVALAGRNAGLRLEDMVAALCSAAPVDADESWAGLFDYGASRLFWMAYAANPAAVKLGGFPAFSSRAVLDRGFAARRREAGLQAFIQAVHEPLQDPLLEMLGPRLQDPSLLTILLGEVTETMQGSGEAVADQQFLTRLFGEAASNYLWFTLRGKAWAQVPPGLPDAALARTLLQGRRVAEWLDPRRRVAAAPDAALAREAEGYRNWRLAIVVLDALTGCAALEELEPRAWNAFLMQVFRAEPAVAEVFDEFGRQKPENVRDLLDLCEFSASRPWEWLGDPEGIEGAFGGEPLDSLFRDLAGRLFGLVPVLLLMAATRTSDGFAFPPALRDVLVRPAGIGSQVQLDGLKATVASGQRIQQDWSDAMNRWNFPAAARSALRVAQADRIRALQAFAAALKPLRPEYPFTPAAPS